MRALASLASFAYVNLSVPLVLRLSWTMHRALSRLSVFFGRHPSVPLILHLLQTDSLDHCSVTSFAHVSSSITSGFIYFADGPGGSVLI